MTLVDAQLLLPVAIGALAGLRRGFVVGLADFVGLALSLAVAATAGPALIGLVNPKAEWTLLLAGVAVVFIVAQLAIGFLAIPIVRTFQRSLTPTMALGWLNIAGGAVPGALQGAALAVAAVCALAVWPLAPGARLPVQQSMVGAALLPYASVASPVLADWAARLRIPAPAAALPAAGQAAPFGKTTGFAVAPAAELEIGNAINADRLQLGLQPLANDITLRKSALAYAEELFTTGRFDHASPTSGQPADRMKRAGALFALAGENLAFAPGAKMAHASLMASAAHRANILSPRFRKVGIAVLDAPGVGLLVVENFSD